MRTANRRAHAPRPWMEPLEPRLLYSADPAAAALDAALPAAVGAEERLVDVVDPVAVTAPLATEPALAVTAQRQELVIVAANVEHVQSLLDDLTADPAREIHIAFLDAERDALDQISSLLAPGDQRYTAVHLVSHGHDGVIDLGNGALDLATLERRGADIAGWGAGFTADGDLLIYGCDVAAQASGRTLIEGLAALTGVDIAASDDATGTGGLGSDWQLEFHSGVIDGALPFGATGLANFAGTLASVAVTTTLDQVDGNTASMALLIADPGADGAISLREAITAANQDGAADIVTVASGTYQLGSALTISNPLTLAGASAASTIIDGNAASRIFSISGAHATITGFTLRNGNASSGGAIDVNSSGSLTLAAAMLRDNQAVLGGGIAVAGQATLDGVTIEGNSASRGGGIYASGGSDVTLLNSTVSGNTASDSGGGLYALGAIAIESSTIALNSAAVAGGGISAQGGSLASLHNSILASNGGGNVGGEIESGGFNIDSDGTAGLNGRGDLGGIDPGLLPLADHGGAVLTHALAAGSVAIDAGGNTAAPGFDARGALRDAIPDIGAYESTNGSAGKLYWADDAGHSIRRVNPDGSAAQTIVSGLGSPTGVAVDTTNGKVYWTDASTRRIQRADLDGANVETLISGLSGPRYVALDLVNGKLYFADTGVLGSTIKRANLDGSGLQTVIAGLLTTPSGIAVDAAGGKVYWTESALLSKTIRRANLDGSGAQTVVSGLLGPVEIELDSASGTIYWTDNTRIQRAGLDGSGVQTLITGLASPAGLALDSSAGRMYWTTTGSALIQRANLDGSGLATVMNPGTRPAGIALATLNGGANQAPITLTLSNAALNENIDTSGGYSVGTLSAVDPDTGEIFSYAVIGGADATHFSIGGSAADELVFDAGVLDFESQDSYQVAVRVTDSAANTFDQTFTLTIGNVNDAPVNALPPPQSTNEDTALVFSSVNGNAMTISDVDAGAGTLQLTLAVNQGTLTLAGTAGLAFASGDGSADASVIFSGSLSAINAALDGLSFAPGADYAGPVQLDLQSSDLGNSGSGGLKQDSDAIIISVDAINDAPLNQLPGAQSVNQDATLVFTAANGNAIVVGDVDAGSGALEVTLTAVQGVVSLSGTAGLGFTAGDGSADASMSFSGTLTAINAALDGLQFTPAAGYTGAAAIQITTGDLGGSGGGGPRTAADTIAIAVDNVNDAPVNSVPAAQQLNQDTTRVFGSASGNAFAIADNDAGSNPLQVTLTAVEGVLSLSGTSGLGFVAGDGSTDASMSFSGTVAAINAALDGLQFTPSPGYVGGASIAITTDDLGNSGIGGPQSDFDVVSITLDNVNDPPVNTLPPAQFTNEDTPVVFSIAGGNAISISDVDAGGGPLEVTLTASQGRASLNGVAGLTFTSGDGSADATMVFSGAASAINAALDGLVFTPAADYAGVAALAVQTSDLGNSGSGGPQLSAGAVAITVTAVNDAPGLVLPGAQATVEDSPLEFSIANANPISVGDVDAGASAVQLTLSVNQGTLTLATTAALAFSTGDGLADASMTFSGTLSAINSALDGLVFTPTANYAGPAVLDLQLSDQGNSGTGGVKLASDTIAIAIDPVDDAPAISGIVNQSGVEDAALGPLVFLLGDVDTPLGALTVTATSDDAARVPNGSLSISGSGANRTLTIVPAANANGGPATITVTVGDASTSVQTSFQVSFAAVNDSPVAGADSYATDSDSVLTVMAASTLANDTDADTGDLLQIASINDAPVVPGNSVTLASGARLNVNADGGFTYDPTGAFADLEPGALAADTFNYVVVDGNGGTSMASVIIGVTGVDTAPTSPPATPSPAGVEDPTTLARDYFPQQEAEQWREDMGATVTEPPPGPSAAAPAALVVTSAAPAAPGGAAPAAAAPAQAAIAFDRDPVINAATAAQRSPVFQERIDGANHKDRAVSAGSAAVVATLPAAVAPVAAPTTAADGVVAGAVASAEFVRGIDDLRRQVEESTRIDQAVVGSSFVASTGLSVGYIVWLLRGGVLLSTALSSLPAWRMIDPLPVLARLDDDDEETHGESLQSMLAEADARHAAVSVAGTDARVDSASAGTAHDAET